MIAVAFQVSSRHPDVSAVQQGLDQGEDLCAASSSGPAGVQVKRPLRNMESSYCFYYLYVCSNLLLLIGGGGGGLCLLTIYISDGGGSI